MINADRLGVKPDHQSSPEDDHSYALSVGRLDNAIQVLGR